METTKRLKNRDRDIKLNIASKNLIKDPFGKIRYNITLETAGLENSPYNRELLKKIVTAKTGVEQHNSTRSITSMKFGPKATKLGWDLIQQPAVYAIVNAHTGRKYIGSSTRPDLRRAVHLYWLKNYYRWGCSNIFFGCRDLAEDVEEFGVDSFHMEILKSMPGADNHELAVEENKILAKQKDETLYNKWTKFKIFMPKVNAALLQLSEEYRLSSINYIAKSNEIRDVCEKYDINYKKSFAKIQEMKARKYRGPEYKAATEAATAARKLRQRQEKDFAAVRAYHFGLSKKLKKHHGMTD